MASTRLREGKRDEDGNQQRGARSCAVGLPDRPPHMTNLTLLSWHSIFGTDLGVCAKSRLDLRQHWQLGDQHDSASPEVRFRFGHLEYGPDTRGKAVFRKDLTSRDNGGVNMGAAASETGADGSAALDRLCSAHPLCAQHTGTTFGTFGERSVRGAFRWSCPQIQVVELTT